MAPDARLTMQNQLDADFFSTEGVGRVERPAGQEWYTGTGKRPQFMEPRDRYTRGETIVYDKSRYGKVGELYDDTAPMALGIGIGVGKR